MGQHSSSRRGIQATAALVGVAALTFGALVVAPAISASAAPAGSGPARTVGSPVAVADYLGAQRAGYGSASVATAKFERAQAAAARIEAEPASATSPSSLATSTWASVGPTAMVGGHGKNVSGGFYGGPNSGRTDSLAVSASGEIYAGTAGGGVWGSVDDGALWTPLTDHVRTGLAIGALATDPTDADIVYAGTGEDNVCGDCFYGDGVLKSTNGGKTWKVQNPHGIFRGVDFASLVVDPGKPEDLFAGTTAGFFESTDGGANWQLAAGAFSKLPTWGVVIDPSTTPSTVFVATAGAGVERSTDGGKHFSRQSEGLPSAATFGVTELGIGTATAAHPEGDHVLYAAVQLNGSAVNANGSDLSLYASADSGAHWSLLTTPAYTNQSYAYGSQYSSDQASYDNTIAVDPADPGHVVAGGIALVSTSDGGATWTDVNNGHNFFSAGANVIHPDQHALLFDGSSTLVGDDGGVYDVNGTIVSNLNSDLDTSQFYQDLGVYDNGAEILGGLQDNGTALYQGQNQWSEVITGDGGYNAINPLDPAQQFGEADEGLYSTSDSWLTNPHYITPRAVYDGPLPKEPGGPDPVLAANFVPAMTLVANPSAIDSPTLYYGATNLFVTTNPGANEPRWTKLTHHAGSFVASITVAPSNPAVVYVGFDDGTLLVSTNATSAAPTFTDISPGIPLWITHIAVAPNNPGSIAVTFADSNTEYFKVPPMVVTGDVTVNSAPTARYSDVTGNLPNGVASNSVVFDHGSLVVATDVGTFSTTTPDGAATVWGRAGLGLPNVQVIGLTEDSQGNLYAATHGRGVWKLTLQS